jgi:hypothetical protein
MYALIIFRGGVDLSQKKQKGLCKLPTILNDLFPIRSINGDDIHFNEMHHNPSFTWVLSKHPSPDGLRQVEYFFIAVE